MMKPLREVLSEEYKRGLARHLHNQGIEMMPDEAEDTLNEALEKIRSGMVAKGHARFATMSNEEVRGYIHGVLREEEKSDG